MQTCNYMTSRHAIVIATNRAVYSTAERVIAHMEKSFLIPEPVTHILMI